MKSNCYALITFLMLLTADFGLAQPFAVGRKTVTYIDASRNNRSIPTEIYYPATASGVNVPVAGNPGDRYPVLVFGHGFVMVWEAYENIWNAVVPEGYIIAFPKTETGFSPSHTEFAKDIAFLVTALQAEGQNPSSLFYQWVDTTSCVMGHSMGGGSSFLAVQYNSSITAVANLAAAETNPSAIAACASITIPALLLIGGNDCITPPANHQLPMYNALASACKTAVTIIGGSHCQFANYNFNCAFGELTCSPGPTITRAQQHAIMNALLIPWLNYQLKGDCNAWIQFQSLLAAGQGITWLQSCTVCQPTSLSESFSPDEWMIYPVPSKGNFVIQGPALNAPASLFIYNLSGKKVFEDQLNGQKHSYTVHTLLGPGIYLAQLQIGEYRFYFKLVFHD